MNCGLGRSKVNTSSRYWIIIHHSVGHAVKLLFRYSMLIPVLQDRTPLRWVHTVGCSATTLALLRDTDILTKGESEKMQLRTLSKSFVVVTGAIDNVMSRKCLSCCSVGDVHLNTIDFVPIAAPNGTNSAALIDHGPLYCKLQHWIATKN